MQNGYQNKRVNNMELTINAVYAVIMLGLAANVWHFSRKFDKRLAAMQAHTEK
tara:strand:- start:138 stop:296 length:159 start_codon:yes stop_codon:yes gene_type:complete